MCHVRIISGVTDAFLKCEVPIIQFETEYIFHVGNSQRFKSHYYSLRFVISTSHSQKVVNLNGSTFHAGTVIVKECFSIKSLLKVKLRPRSLAQLRTSRLAMCPVLSTTHRHSRFSEQHELIATQPAITLLPNQIHRHRFLVHLQLSAYSMGSNIQTRLNKSVTTNTNNIVLNNLIWSNLQFIRLKLYHLETAVSFEIDINQQIHQMLSIYLDKKKSLEKQLDFFFLSKIKE